MAKAVTPDYELFKKYQNNPAQLSYEFFIKYKNLINKKATLYSHVSKGKIDPEDFSSDTYLAIVKMVNGLKEEKMNPERFMFHAYIKFSIQKVLKKHIKISKSEINCLDDDEEPMDISCEKYNYNVLKLNVPAFMAQLSDRQKFILRKIQEGVIYKDIQKDLGCSYGIVPIEVRKIRKIAKVFF